MLEKPSEPAASAGRGAFLIEGYCKRESSALFVPVRRGPSPQLDVVLVSTYIGGLHTTVLEFLKLWGRSCRSLDELE
jgi:hypothetical protein